jgi:hypothetical protein
VFDHDSEIEAVPLPCVALPVAVTWYRQPETALGAPVTNHVVLFPGACGLGQFGPLPESADQA